MGIGEIWDQLVKCIVRPPRDSDYTVEDLIGGQSAKFSLPGYRGYTARREDLTLVNKRGFKLVCSHYIPEKVQGRDNRLPCVIYCHCNSGSRRDCEEALYQLLPLGISVFSLDFAGSGLSDGEWVSLGAHEVDDVEVAVQHLRATGQVSTLGLWGRSMGAVTALLYSQRDPSIAGIVLDSPFSSLTELMMEIVEEQQLPIPKALMKVALAAMKRSVRKRAEFDISEVTPLSVVPQSFIPALFGHATGDSFIKIHHSERLYAAYAGDKNFIKVEGDHNSARPAFFKNSVAIFFTHTLQLDQMIVGGNSSYLQHMREFDAAAASASGGSRAPAAEKAAAATPPLPTHSTLARPGQGLPWALDSLRSGSASLGLAPSEGVHQGLSDAEDMEALLTQEQILLGEEEALEKAIKASLEDLESVAKAAGAAQGAPQQATPSTVAASQSNGGLVAGTVGSRAVKSGRLAAAPVRAAVQAAAAGQGHAAPGSAEDEEEMLRQALALSLQETSAVPPREAAAAAQPQNAVDLLVRELSAGMTKVTK